MDGRTENQVSLDLRQFHYVHLADIITRRCFVELEYLHPLSHCDAISWMEIPWLLVLGLQWVQMSRDHVFHGGPKYTILSLSGRGIFSNPFSCWQYLALFWSSAPTKWKIDWPKLGVVGPPNFNGSRPQILDQIYKITPISDLLSYKGCLSVEQPQKSSGKRKKEKKKKTSVEK